MDVVEILFMEKKRKEREMMATLLEQFAIEYVNGEHIDSKVKARMFWEKDKNPSSNRMRGKTGVMKERESGSGEWRMETEK